MTQCSDDAHELRIQYLGRRVQMAHAAGNHHGAANWMQAEMLAIAQRSPEQQARINAALDDGIDYFAVMGARAGAALKAEAI